MKGTDTLSNIAIFVIPKLILLLGHIQGNPGYHIVDDTSAKKAVVELASDSSKFEAAVYQAKLDKNLWRLILAAYDYLELMPKNPERQCSFAMSYFESLGFGTYDSIPKDKVVKLQGLYGEAIRCIKEAVTALPESVTAHLTYGKYYMSQNGYEKVQPMLHEFRTAVKLGPNRGWTHYWLAKGYNSSGDETIKTAQKMIQEFKRALELDPRLTSSYLSISYAYMWPCMEDSKNSRIYLAKYLAARTDQAKRARRRDGDRRPGVGPKGDRGRRAQHGQASRLPAYRCERPRSGCRAAPLLGGGEYAGGGRNRKPLGSSRNSFGWYAPPLPPWADSRGETERRTGDRAKCPSPERDYASGRVGRTAHCRFYRQQAGVR